MGSVDGFSGVGRGWLGALFILCAAAPIFGAELATIKNAAEPAYLEMSSASPVVTVLHKGDVVSVKYSIGTTDGTWCVITQAIGDGKSGHVPCGALDPLAPAPRADQAQKVSPKKAVSVSRGSPGKAIKPPPQTGDLMVAFGGAFPFVARPNRNIDYRMVPSREHFFVHVPASYTGAAPYGLIVFTDTGGKFTSLPPGWAEILDRHKLLLVAAQRAGNDQPTARRLGLGILGALEMKSRYNVDSRRVYAAGFSGGARISNLLGFYESDVFSGTIQSCGADFYEPVPHQYATSWVDTAGYPYGLLINQATPAEIQQAKRTVRFALITGSNDFRRGNILDIYHGGYRTHGFHSILFDVPGMAHDTPNEHTLAAAIAFLESK